MSERQPFDFTSLHLPRDYNAAAHFIDRHLAEGRGDKVAYIEDRGETTYRELARRVNRAGNALRALGVCPEQRVLLCMLDTIDFPACFWGAIKIGAVPVPVNTLFTAADYEYLLRDSRAVAAIVAEPLLGKLAPILGGLPFLRHVVVASETETGAALPEGARSLAALMAEADDALEPAPTTPDDVAFWLYSSGSTGAPKGAVHLHGHLVQTAALYGVGVLGIREDDVVFSAAKLFFAYGLGNAMTFPLHVGATAVLLAERPTPEVVLRVMRERQPTIFYGVPTLYASILGSPSLASVEGSSRLRVCVSAGEALPAEIGERWRARFGADILDGIGSTEMLHIFLSNRPDDIRYGTTGKPVPGYTLRLVDEHGHDVPDDTIGELWVRGMTSAVAYWNNRQKSVETFHGPWTRTGDKYSRDSEGYYRYHGRGDDMLKVGGIWVSPFEVESALAAHPAVLEAAVVGHADDGGMIKPKAFVVLRDGGRGADGLVGELQVFVKGRLAPYKYPRWIEIVESLPKTATGKIQRFMLRARAPG